jgi:RNA exonuclease 4
MALYRLHKIEWEQSIRPATEAYKAKINKGKGKEKRKRDGDSDDDEEDETSEKPDKKRKDDFPGGGRRGVSSGLSVIVRRGGVRVDGPRQRGVPRSSTGQDGASGGSWWEHV